VCNYECCIQYIEECKYVNCSRFVAVASKYGFDSAKLLQKMPLQFVCSFYWLTLRAVWWLSSSVHWSSQKLSRIKLIVAVEHSIRKLALLILLPYSDPSQLHPWVAVCVSKTKCASCSSWRHTTTVVNKHDFCLDCWCCHLISDKCSATHNACCLNACWRHQSPMRQAIFFHRILVFTCSFFNEVMSWCCRFACWMMMTSSSVKNFIETTNYTKDVGTQKC